MVDNSTIATIIGTIFSIAISIFLAFYIRSKFKTKTEKIQESTHDDYLIWLFSDLELYDIQFSGLYEYVEEKCGKLTDTRSNLESEPQLQNVLYDPQFNKTCGIFRDAINNHQEIIWKNIVDVEQVVGTRITIMIKQYTITSQAYITHLGQDHIHYHSMLQGRLNHAKRIIKYLKEDKHAAELPQVKDFIEKWSKHV